jgi:uncharacterized protein (UPF0261 family)
MSKPKVLMIVTLDTKAVEAKFVRDTLEANGVDVVHLDASIRGEVEGGAEITPRQVAAAAGKTLQEVRDLKHEGNCMPKRPSAASWRSAAPWARPWPAWSCRASPTACPR